MKIRGMETNELILEELGSRIKARRIVLNLTQKELANEANVSWHTVVNTEKGENVSMMKLISILRALRLIDNLDLLIPEQKTNPMDILELGHRRQRVSKKNEDNEKSPWVWGDEK